MLWNIKGSKSPGEQPLAALRTEVLSECEQMSIAGGWMTADRSPREIPPGPPEAISILPPFHLYVSTFPILPAGDRTKCSYWLESCCCGS